MTINTIGWIGSLFLAGCGIPQAINCYRTKSAEGLSWAFLIAWLLGEVFTIIFILAQPGSFASLLTNYSINIISICVMIYYKSSK